MQAKFNVLAIAVALTVSLGTTFAQTVPTKGQVTKIDEAAGKITLRHEPIKNLDMDSMTMIFRVKDPMMLKSVKVGDAVAFEADRVDGAITVMSIRRE